MKGTNLAEWLLRRTTTPEHAAAQLGDLLELSRTHDLAQTRGPLWFWRSIFATCAHAAARPTLAFLAAFALSQLVEQLWNRGLFGNRPDLNSVHTTGALFLVPLTLVPIYALIRYGWRDPYARQSLFFSLPLILVTAAILAFNPEPGLYCILFAAPAAILILLLTRRSIALRPLAQLASAVVINLIGMVGIIVLSFIVALTLTVWLRIPDAAFNFFRTISSVPLCELINAAACLFMIRASNRIRAPKPLAAQN